MTEDRSQYLNLLQQHKKEPVKKVDVLRSPEFNTDQADAIKEALKAHMDSLWGDSNSKNPFTNFNGTATDYMKNYMKDYYKHYPN